MAACNPSVTENIASSIDYENSGTTIVDAGQSFTLTATKVICGMALFGSRGATYSGTIKIELLSGSYTGTVVATTGTFNTSTLTAYGSGAWNDIAFTSLVELAAGTYYLKLTIISGSALDEIRWNYSSNSYSGGTYYRGGATAAVDRIFKVYGTDPSTPSANTTDFFHFM